MVDKLYSVVDTVLVCVCVGVCLVYGWTWQVDVDVLNYIQMGASRG